MTRNPFNACSTGKAGATSLTTIATTPSSGRASGQRVSHSFSASSHVPSRSTRSFTHPNAKQIPKLPRVLAHPAVRWLFRLIQRVFIAEAVLWLTGLLCVLMGFPAILTAFCVALVGFIVNLWIAIRTFGPSLRKFVKGGRA